MKREKPIVTCVVGARPNFIKIGPIIAALRDDGRLAPHLVHTGQHYDYAMNERFFVDLDIPAPDANLAVGSGTHAAQTGEIMMRLEPVLAETKPDLLLVVGDVNSTLAASLVAVKLGIPIAHVEAGLRSFDRDMPEEINRILTDQISRYLFVTEKVAIENLAREGISQKSIHFVGNVMIDALRKCLPHAKPARETLRAAGREPPDVYALATLHRPSNVDDDAVLSRLLDAFRRIGREVPVIFPLHPRTRTRIEKAGLAAKLEAPEIVTLDPTGYVEMLGLLKEASVVLTDSGGLQEETTALGVPCLTLRNNTERPVTVEQGTSVIVGNDAARILTAFADIRAGRMKRPRQPELWDGQAARRIATILGDTLCATSNR